MDERQKNKINKNLCPCTGINNLTREARTVLAANAGMCLCLSEIQQPWWGMHDVYGYNKIPSTTTAL